MRKGLFVSDLHAALRLPFAKVDPGGVSSDRLRDVVSILTQVGDRANEDVAFVAILGDLFDQRHPDGATLVGVSRVLGELARTVPTYILPGNHDAVDRDGRLYSLQFYEELNVEGLRVLGHETVEPIEGVLLHAVPWLPEERARKRIRARAKGLPKSARNLLLFHQGVRGALWDSGRPSNDGLDPDIGDEFALALTGHYHRPQEFRSGRFLGSPLDLRFGDEETPSRGFWEVDFEAKELAPELVPTNYPRFATVRIDLDAGEHPDAVHLETEAPGAAYVRIVVDGSAADIERVRPDLNKLSQSPPEGVRAVKLDLRARQEGRQRLEVEAGLSLSELTRRYAEQFAGDHDAAELAALGVRLLDEAP